MTTASAKVVACRGTAAMLLLVVAAAVGAFGTASAARTAGSHLDHKATAGRRLQQAPATNVSAPSAATASGVALSTPLLLRLMELANEDAKDDAQLVAAVNATQALWQARVAASSPNPPWPLGAADYRVIERAALGPGEGHGSSIHSSAGGAMMNVTAVAGGAGSNVTCADFVVLDPGLLLGIMRWAFNGSGGSDTLLHFVLSRTISAYYAQPADPATGRRPALPAAQLASLLPTPALYRTGTSTRVSDGMGREMDQDAGMHMNRGSMGGGDTSLFGQPSKGGGMNVTGPLIRNLSASTPPAPDVISLTVPLFIRLLEWSREAATTDVDLHLLTERVLAAGAMRRAGAATANLNGTSQPAGSPCVGALPLSPAGAAGGAGGNATAGQMPALGIRDYADIVDWGRLAGRGAT